MVYIDFPLRFNIWDVLGAATVKLLVQTAQVTLGLGSWEVLFAASGELRKERSRELSRDVVPGEFNLALHLLHLLHVPAFFGSEDAHTLFVVPDVVAGVCAFRHLKECRPYMFELACAERRPHLPLMSNQYVAKVFT